MRVLPVSPGDMREIYDVLTALESAAMPRYSRAAPQRRRTAAAGRRHARHDARAQGRRPRRVGGGRRALPPGTRRARRQPDADGRGRARRGPRTSRADVHAAAAPEAGELDARTHGHARAHPGRRRQGCRRNQSRPSRPRDAGTAGDLRAVPVRMQLNRGRARDQTPDHRETQCPLLHSSTSACSPATASASTSSTPRCRCWTNCSTALRSRSNLPRTRPAHGTIRRPAWRCPMPRSPRRATPTRSCSARWAGPRSATRTAPRSRRSSTCAWRWSCTPACARRARFPASGCRWPIRGRGTSTWWSCANPPKACSPRAARARSRTTKEAQDTMVITRRGSERVHDFSFRLAQRRKARGRPGRVTCVDKANVFRSMAFFRKIFDERALRVSRHRGAPQLHRRDGARPDPQALGVRRARHREHVRRHHLRPDRGAGRRHGHGAVGRHRRQATRCSSPATAPRRTSPARARPIRPRRYFQPR